MFTFLLGLISPDVINALIETLGGFFILFSIIRLLKDKTVQGVSLVPVVFLWFWGAWNIFYYPHLDQTISFIAAIIVLSMNSIWTGLLIYYKKNPGDDDCY